MGTSILCFCCICTLSQRSSFHSTNSKTEMNYLEVEDTLSLGKSSYGAGAKRLSLRLGQN